MKKFSFPGYKRYNNFGSHLKKKFGEKVFKICIDAGFTCPNRDGSKGRGGCIYCNNDSFKPDNIEARQSVTQQLTEGIFYQRKRYHAHKFIAYFQPFSNTYGETSLLRKLYEEALSIPDVVGLAIGTRPDCITDETLELFEELARL